MKSGGGLAMLSEIKPQLEEIADRLGEMREYL